MILLIIGGILILLGIIGYLWAAAFLAEVTAAMEDE